MTTLFISDIHLGDEHPEISERFCRFLGSDAVRRASALYILGDLFEAWIGDDAVQPEHRAAIAALKQLSDAGVAIYIMHGNRDFLLGMGFEEMTGATLIEDPLVIDLHGTPTLLMHGDSLCTDDADYQSFRLQVRTPQWQQGFLALGEAQRLAFARQARNESQRRSAEKSMEIMDVNDSSVISAFRHHGVLRMIHGHTHRPAVHHYDIVGEHAERIVLGDWYQQGSALRCDKQGCHTIGLDHSPSSGSVK